MAFRGRGSGKISMSITTEQLGLKKGELLPPPILQPPPKYPSLEFKAPTEQITAEFSYLLELKRDFAETVPETLSNIQSVVVKKDIERYSDRYEEIISKKFIYDKFCDWSFMPKELTVSVAKRKLKELKENVKKLNLINIEKRLQELEKKESINENKIDENVGTGDDSEEKDPDENIEDEEAEFDEEMDDDTDYVNNYFDNGEGYDDEEDNLDDGPIY